MARIGGFSWLGLAGFWFLFLFFGGGGVWDAIEQGEDRIGENH